MKHHRDGKNATPTQAAGYVLGSIRKRLPKCPIMDRNPFFSDSSSFGYGATHGTTINFE